MNYRAVGTIKDLKFDGGTSQKTNQPWSKAIVILDTTEPTKDGHVFENAMQVEFYKEEYVKILKAQIYPVGTSVTVEFGISGKEWNGRFFNTLYGRSIAANTKLGSDDTHKEAADELYREAAEKAAAKIVATPDPVPTTAADPFGEPTDDMPF